MKSKSLAVVALLALAAGAQASQYTTVVSATNANSAVNFTDKVVTVDVQNEGPAAVFVDTDGVASASDTTSFKVGVCEGITIDYPQNFGPTTIGVITASSTATVRTAGYYAVGNNEPSKVFKVTRYALSPSCASASDFSVAGNLTVAGNATVTGNGTITGTLLQTGVATFTAAPVFSSTTASRILLSDASKGLTVNGAITSNAVPKSVSSGASLSASALSDDATTVSSTEPVSVTGNVTTSAQYVVTPTAQTVASDGAGTAAAFNVAATVGKVYVTCNDTDGCAGTLLETSAVSGASLTIVNVSSNAVTLADTSGVSETTGAISLGQWDSVTYDYVVDRWVEKCTSNN